MVRSAASILQRTSRVIHSGRAETTRISSCQVSESSACWTSSPSGPAVSGQVEVTEGALADGGEDALRVEFAGEDDFSFGTYRTNAPQ